MSVQCYMFCYFIYFKFYVSYNFLFQVTVNQARKVSGHVCMYVCVLVMYVCVLVMYVCVYVC
jgi:hypothetical protein